jgi:hypothetical protein
MWDSQGGDGRGYGLLGCNVGRFLVNPTFRNNISPPCSGPKNKPSKGTRKLWAISELHNILIQRISVKLIFPFTDMRSFVKLQVSDCIVKF